MKRKYYSQRENGGKEKISLENFKNLFSAVYQDFYNKKYFCQKLDLGCCVDMEDADLSGEMLRKTRKDLWPILDQDKIKGKLKDYNKNELFDTIEFLFDYISKPIETPDLHPHTWGECGYHYEKFSEKEGQEEFRKEINDFLADFEEGYELSKDGEILHKADLGLNRLLTAEKIDIGEGNIKDRMIQSENLFYSGRSSINDRKNAVKELADCFEFLRDDMKNVLNKKDEADLFNIANNFAIRHHNEKQKTDYDLNIWLSWMFHFYLATLHAALHLIDKERNNDK